MRVCLIKAKSVLNKSKLTGSGYTLNPLCWVFLSTVTDPYNSFEAKYQITRQCLEILFKYQWPVFILTKSVLILRDIGLLKQFKQIEVDFTFTTLKIQVTL